MGLRIALLSAKELKLVMSPGVSTHSKTPRQDKGSATAVEPVVEVLTQREFEVLKLMADGLTTKAIAHTLGTSFKTAACHRSHILDKIGVGTTVSA